MANLGAMIALAVYPIYPYKDVHLSVAAVDVVLAAGGIWVVTGRTRLVLDRTVLRIGDVRDAEQLRPER